MSSDVISPASTNACAVCTTDRTYAPWFFQAASHGLRSSTEVRAELARASGDEAVRRRELRKAQRLFAEMGAPIRAEQVARELETSS